MKSKLDSSFNNLLIEKSVGKTSEFLEMLVFDLLNVQSNEVNQTMQQVEPELFDLRGVLKLEMSLGNQVKDSVKAESGFDYGLNEHFLQVLHFEELRNPE